MIVDPITGTIILWSNVSGALAAISLGGMAMIEQLQAVDPQALSSWEGISFKVFLILALGTSMLINIALAKWVAGQLIPALKELAISSQALKDGIHHLSNATKRCLRHQGIDLEAAE